MSFTKIPSFASITVHEQVDDLGDVVRLLEHDEVLLVVTRSFHSTFEYFFCRTRLGIRVFESPAWQSARICSLCRSRRILICSLSKLWLGISLTFGIWESNGFTTGLSVLSWLTDDDWLDDRPSSEWSARLRHAPRSVLPMVTSS